LTSGLVFIHGVTGLPLHLGIIASTDISVGIAQLLRGRRDAYSILDVNTHYTCNIVPRNMEVRL
jgi:hypothetical protein